MKKNLLPYVEGPPLTLPADTRRKPRSLADAVHDFILSNYDKDGSVGKCALSMNTTDSFYGGAVDDKVMLAHKIKVAGDKLGDQEIKAASVHQIRVKIERALGRHNLNRTYRLRIAAEKRLQELGD